ncbi:hypothetical protein KC19_1G076300 [Ceratodon purpureus]|uniref:Uncharacterized protein n=1 Tax=Ceratodon purpureus TaxID=3225 RepID=A0A8T0J526_CERPU|nr:hypothetical protein KC19_1G076300 [Ceratodon purpureus]
MARWSAGAAMQVLGLCGAIWLIVGVAASANADPIPKTWPLQFHSQMYQNRSGKLSMIDLWYDFPNGRNLNLIQNQLGSVLHDVEYTNGTSYYYDLEAGTCREVHFPVGILRPDWLSDATYAGVEEKDGFKCNVWEKVEFIRYYEDVETKRPVSWYFYTSGMDLHIMTFEEGNVLDDIKWQAPVSCFQKTSQTALTASEDDDKSRKGLLSKASLGGRKGLHSEAYVT